MGDVQVRKLDAALRQLECAVRLYFSDDDPVSVHTLTCAAYGLLRDIGKQRSDGRPMLKDSLMQMARPGAEDILFGKLNEAQNFFKHADRDSDSVLTFRTEQTDFLLLDACYKYGELVGKDPRAFPLFSVFHSWFVLNNPEMIKGDVDEFVAAFRGATRESFFTDVLPMAREKAATYG